MVTPVSAGILQPREPAIDLVRIISEGTYTSFPQALKEFISNAFDADAKRVDIRFEEESGTIVIRDDGVGMTLDEFRDFFASIARPGKSGARSVRGKTASGRHKIGRFGIGSLAIVGAADKFTIRSTRKASGQGFEASIDLRELRSHYYKGHDLSSHWRFPYESWTGETSSNHFTEVRIERLNPDILANLQRPAEKTLGDHFERISQLSGLEELAWQLGLICPVAYAQAYPVNERFLKRGKDRFLFDKGRELLRQNFHVFLNGQPVRRHISLPSYDPSKLKDTAKANNLLRRGLGFEIRYLKAPPRARVHYEGYLVIQASQVFPEELRGLLIRLRGTAIGWHRTFNIATAGLSTMLPSMSGEVWVDGLEDALQFDRESFREDHPQYRWLREQLVDVIAEEAPQFRQRSEQRTKAEKRTRSSKRKPATGASTTAKRPSATEKTSGESFLPLSALDGNRPYITRLLPQINGCWNNEYYEACAVMCRRLIETMIIELYSRRGWVNEVKDPNSKNFHSLKTLVNKICGDARFGLDTKVQGGLKALKELGDIAAHDFRVQMTRTDLEQNRTVLRLTCERLTFEIVNTKVP